MKDIEGFMDFRMDKATQKKVLAYAKSKGVKIIASGVIINQVVERGKNIHAKSATHFAAGRSNLRFVNTKRGFALWALGDRIAHSVFADRCNRVLF